MILLRTFSPERRGFFLRKLIPSHYNCSDTVTTPPLAGLFGDGIAKIHYSRRPQRPDVLIDEYDNIYVILCKEGNQFRVVNEEDMYLLINTLFCEVTIV